MLKQLNYSLVWQGSNDSLGKSLQYNNKTMIHYEQNMRLHSSGAVLHMHVYLGVTFVVRHSPIPQYLYCWKAFYSLWVKSQHLFTRLLRLVIFRVVCFRESRNTKAFACKSKVEAVW